VAAGSTQEETGGPSCVGQSIKGQKKHELLLSHFLPANKVLSIQAPKLGLVLTLPLLSHLSSLLVPHWSFPIIPKLLVPAIFLQASSTVSPVTKTSGPLPQCSSVKPEHSRCALSQGHTQPTYVSCLSKAQWGLRQSPSWQAPGDASSSLSFPAPGIMHCFLRTLSSTALTFLPHRSSSPHPGPPSPSYFRGPLGPCFVLLNAPLAARMSSVSMPRRYQLTSSLGPW